jgi:AAA domain
MPRPLVVEFLGLPGVGKSHATRLVASRLAALGTPASSAGLRINHELGAWRRVATKCSICAAEAIRRPRNTWHVFRALRRSGQRARLDPMRLAYNWLFLSGLLRRARTRPVVELLDEGIFQLLWSVGFAGAEGSMRECSVMLLQRPASEVMPDMVVLVEAPLETVQARVAARGSRAGRVDRMPPGEQPRALERGADLLTEVLWESIGLTGPDSVPVVRRVRSGAPHELDADIDALVAELVSLAAR